jgi:hypothetical protein
MEEIVKVLLEKETIERDEFVALMQDAKPLATLEQSIPPTASSTPPEAKSNSSLDKPAPVRLPNLRPEPGVA